ncbi:MAG: TIGR04283 family arsenosugar biosynthesis glycosyltransferase [Rhodocyclaceae bacterium]|nr:TIGR04283 family arsenosugar biosynthesis glycosyltransferase [Rhodocyclaceae bacterium]
MSDSRLSIIVPVLNEAHSIEASLTALQPLRRRGVEIVVADGGSDDNSAALARPYCDQIVLAPRGRAVQMNAGAAAARGDILLFLHADTQLPPHVMNAVQGDRKGHGWGHFDVRISGSSVWLPVIARMMNLRSRLTGIATGDQAIFVSRELFERVGGYAEIPLMEDIDLSRRLRACAWPRAIRDPVWTSGRRWDTQGAWRTILLMWRLRLSYWLGASATSLARQYRDVRSPL